MLQLFSQHRLQEHSEWDSARTPIIDACGSHETAVLIDLPGSTCRRVRGEGHQDMERVLLWEWAAGMQMGSIVGVQPLRKLPECPSSLRMGSAWLKCKVTGEGKVPSSEEALIPHFLLFCWFQTRSGAGWKRVLRSLCHSRTRVPLLAAMYLLMVHVLLILCFTGHL